MRKAFASWGAFADLQYSLFMQFRTVHSAFSGHLEIVLRDVLYLLVYPPLREAISLTAVKGFSQNHFLSQTPCLPSQLIPSLCPPG